MRQCLPIDTVVPELISALRKERGAVLVAPPGAGKTTRVPPAIIDSGLLSREHSSVILLQPRRVAARAAASRIAEERGGAVGQEVGYHIRFERRLGPRTRIRVLTEGILTRTLLRDPFLEGVGAVVLDEFHERSLDVDLALALLKEVRATVREDLLLVVMSATLDAGPVAEFLDGAPIVRSEGRTFPVAIEHRPDPKGKLSLEHAATVVLDSIDAGDSGDALIFLPGMDEIRRMMRMIGPAAEAAGRLVLPLHGQLSAAEQDRALRPADRPKLVLATNVAETSLTIDGVRLVVDGGLARFASYDPARGIDRLELGRISRASAEQRAGRAGRTAAGRCIRLWSPREERGMAARDVPEIRRVDLAPTVLALKAWGRADPAQFGWFEAPPEEAIRAAEVTLQSLGALGAEGHLTSLGDMLMRLPVHPRLARLMLYAAEAGRAYDGAALAAIVSERDFLIREGGRPPEADRRADSDLLDRLDRLGEAEAARFAPALRGRGIEPFAARRVARLRDDLWRAVGRRADDPERQEDDEALLKALLVAFPDRVARRRANDPMRGVQVGGRGVRLEASSVVREGEFFLAIDPRDDRRAGVKEARVSLASAVRREWLEELFPGQVRTERAVRFDADRGRVVAESRRLFRDLILSEEPHGAVDAQEAGRVMAEALAVEAEAFFRGDDAAARLLDRLEFGRKHLAEEAWPEFGGAEFAGAIEALCWGCRSIDEVSRRSPAGAVASAIGRRLMAVLDTEVPDAIQVPTGNRIRLAYEPGRPPVLAVRLQELFGLPETPRICRGRVPVLLHLLGPNYRPVQITDDLPSFWTNTYPQVRKDLRARYPKHSWPEDPRTAPPVAKGSPRKA